MKQRPIDLLPQGVLARTQAGVVAGRYVAALLIGVVLTGLMATHAHLVRDLARQRLRAAQKQADITGAEEATAQKLRDDLAEAQRFVDSYDDIALPLDLSRLVATVASVLPRSATLERISLDTTTRAAAPGGKPGPAAKGSGPAGRVLLGELSGFAATDVDVIRIVQALQALGLFEQVSLDISTSRDVRRFAAREFRISLRADLDLRYKVSEPAPPPPSVAEGPGVQ